MGRLEGKTALITGGARGQGAEEARLFAAEGATVVLTDRLVDEGHAMAASLGGEFLEHDVTSESAWQAVIDAALDRHQRIDILINNAGVFYRSKLVDTTLSDFDQLMAINCTGVFLGMRAVAPTMCEQRGGSIINISSVAGISAAPGAFAYGASKWAVRGMTKTAAVELARYGVRCNSIHPGMIETDMLDQVFEGDPSRRDRMVKSVPLGETASAIDIANMALFLASDESRYATGSEFVVDGGMVAI